MKPYRLFASSPYRLIALATFVAFLLPLMATPIRIVYENDVHCALDGYVSIAGVRDSLRQLSTDVALVSSGDYLQGGTMGSISNGKFCVDMINATQYDVLTLGNHEFDYRVPRLMELIASMDADVVSSNLYQIQDTSGSLLLTSPLQGESEGALRLLPPYVIKDFSDSRRVAFVGVTTPTAMVDERYAFLDGNDTIYSLCPDSFVTVVQRAVNAARGEGATTVVLLSHMGEAEARWPQYSSAELVAATSGIDVVLDAHSHDVISSQYVANLNGDRVLISQTGNKVTNVGVLTIDTDQDTLYTELIPSGSCPKSVAVQHVLDSLNDQCAPILNQVVGHTDFLLTIYDADGVRVVRTSETNMGDLVTDAFRITQSTQLGIQNGGGIRADIPAGDITYGQAIDVLSFGNMLGTYRVTGQMLVDFLEEGCKTLPKEGTFMQISGLRMKVDTTQHPTITIHMEDSTVSIEGPRRVYDVEILQSDSTYVPVVADQTYTLTASNYLIFQQGIISMYKCEVIQTNLTEEYNALKQYIINDLGGVVPERYRAIGGQGRMQFVARTTDLESPSQDGSQGSDSCTKLLRNGRLYILRSAHLYTLQGQRVE